MSAEVTIQTPIPPAIAAGIVQVMANVKRLAKEDENKFNHYNYASIDAFLEAMGPLLAEAKIFIVPEEESLEIVETKKADRDGSTAWLQMRWSFLIGHASGVAYGPIHRTVIVPASGAQAFGSSLSYALKQFMRGVFQIPTGDADDPDAQKKEQLPNRGSKAKDSTASARRADAWRAIEEAEKPKDVLTVATKVRDDKSLPDNPKVDVLDFARERMWDFAQRTIKAVTTPEKAEEAAKWYGQCWLFTGEQKTQVVAALGGVRETLIQEQTKDPKKQANGDEKELRAAAS